MKSISIRGCDTSRLDQRDYDVYIACVGYEKRSRYIAESKAPQARRYVASAFRERQIFAFDDNWAFYYGSKYEIEEHDAAEFKEWLDRLLRELAATDRPARICVDISSMSRFRMASVVSSITENTPAAGIVVDFVYAIAMYSPPPKTAGPITALEPVLPEFAGWTDAPESATVAVVGLGYEPDKVIGAIDYFEPASVWAFVPVGNDEQFLSAVKKSNEKVWDDVPEDHRLRYKVLEPCNSFVQLESLCFGLMSDARPILIPFGPKIFAVLCLLVGTVHPNIGVWRVSGGQSEEPIGRSAHGAIAGIQCEFLGQPQSLGDAYNPSSDQPSVLH